MTQSQTIACPQCGKPAPIDTGNAYRPFCSRRCKLIDLGDWLDESNRIPDPGAAGDGHPWGDGGQSSSDAPH